MVLNHKSILVFILLILLSLSLAGCGDGSGDSSNTQPLAPVSSLPDEIRAAPASVQEAYRFALANPTILEQIPCYCGCGSVGHKNNYQCYVAGSGADGKPIFDSHALG